VPTPETEWRAVHCRPVIRSRNWPRGMMSPRATRRPDGQDPASLCYLDLTHLDAAFLRETVPGIDALCRALIWTLRRTPSLCAAVLTITWGGPRGPQRPLDPLGLWAAGEVTSFGLHGANRLRPTAFWKGLVSGARAAEDISHLTSRDGGPPASRGPPCGEPGSPLAPRALDLADVRALVACLNVAECWDHPFGDRPGDAASRLISGEAMRSPGLDSPDGWTLQNIADRGPPDDLGRRRASGVEGVHTRSDYPQTDPSWARQISFFHYTGELR